MIISHYNVIVLRGRQLASSLCVAFLCTAYSWDLPGNMNRVEPVPDVRACHARHTPQHFYDYTSLLVLPPFPPLLHMYPVSVGRVRPSDFTVYAKGPIMRKMNGRVKWRRGAKRLDRFDYRERVSRNYRIAENVN